MKIDETMMQSIGSGSWAFSGRQRRLVLCSVFFLGFLFAVTQQASAAVLGMDRASYGVWDRSGWHTVAEYPFTRGQEMDISWTEVHPARSNYTWTAIDNLLQFADDQNQAFTVKIGVVGSGGVGNTVPLWMSNTVPLFTEVANTNYPTIVPAAYTYGLYTNANFKMYYSEMVKAFAKHLRQDVATNLQNRIAFVRCDTGCTGDEEPYENANLIPAQYQISAAEWLNFRLWAFEEYRKAFQEGPGPVIPLLFVHCEPISYAEEWSWVTNNVTGGYGAKYDGSTRGHHLSESRMTADQFKPLAVDSNFKIFSRSEMDGTWTWPYWQFNLKLSAYWCALEQLNAGQSIWDVTGSFLENTYIDGLGFAFDFFNKWAAELDPATARGGFCVFHEGLDSSDTNKFPVATYGAANMANTNRYTAICAAYTNQGARMDHLVAATWGHVKQRPNQTNYNDSGWKILPGNYDRFITQINPTNESLGLWRVRGTLTASSHPYDRFARRFDRASGRNAMYFNVHDSLMPTSGQRIQLSVIYLDSGTNRFGLLYDAVGNSQKSAFTVTKANSNTWKTNSVVVTDWVFGNNGPNGSDLVLTNVDLTGDTTFNSIELVKLVNVTMNTVGSGTVSARNDATVYSPVSGTNYTTGLRLEMTVTPASGWEFAGWSGDLSGTDPRAILYPTNVNTQVTATFVNTGATSATDDFETGTWAGGTGWTGGWSTSGGALVDTDSSLAAHLTANGQITRIAATPIVTGGQLAFNWHIKSLEAGESAQAEIYDGSWHVVWTKASLVEESGTTNINLSAYSNISQVRFTVNAGGGADHFYIDDVSLSGTAAVTTHTLTANGGMGGTVSPASASVPTGGSTNFVITASNYYRIATLKTNNADVIGMSFDNNSTTTNFIWSSVQTSGVLAATFTARVTTNAPAQVPYEWLAGYGLTNYNTDATNDVDVDGLTAWQEYIAGTVPTNATSCFAAAQATRNVVTWNAVSGRLYSVYWSTNLVQGFTMKLDNITLPQSSYTNATPDPRVNHYQLKVRMQ